ncbi:acetyl-CoA C-acetyltransferase [Faecalicatena contorta]|uniref:acetyl-CoA C-acetyltransferase n=1 Tax=Faecalicatena contorta TaxID=39482 RepID=UPI002ED2D1ED|nr:acetyl-CoA C-acetyltransferase [Faecalicatena contorta]
MNKKIVLAGACRTPIGNMGGSLSTVPAAQLGAVVIKEAIIRAGIRPEDVEHVYMGNVIQAGLGQNVARQAAVKAGIPVEVPAVTINVVCGSGLNCVNMAAQMIESGEAEVVVAGGMENMSMAPYVLDKARFGYRMGDAAMKDSMVKDALWDAFGDYHMGITAENVARQWKLTREELDQFALESQKKAVRAMEAGIFEEEIVPVEVKGKKETVLVTRDEGPRSDTSLEKIARLNPAFLADGVVTAANASSINDGAAAVVVMSGEKARELGAKPLAYWEAGALAGVDPAIMGIGPVAATRKLLDRQDLSVSEIDLVEANEAFASQSLAVKRELQIPDEKLNISGGAIALGHPVGASGARILVTLLYGLKRTGKELGLATLCIGGGMGCAALVRRI